MEEKIMCELCECEFEESFMNELDNSFLCDDCYSERVETCECCNEEHDRDMMNEIDDVYVCNDCYDYNTMTCEICGEVHLSDEMVEIPNHRDEDVVVCQSCMENYSFYCNYHDREEIDTSSWEDSTVHIMEYGVVCRDGFEYGDFCWCSDCEEYYHIDDMAFDDESDEYYCLSCYEEYHNCGYITSYHNHDYDEKFMSEEEEEIEEEEIIFFGSELEVEKKNIYSTERKEMSEILYDLDNDDVLCYERDGSLDDGFEIITKPMSFNYIVDNQEFFKDMINTLESNGYQSYATTTCGHHIHMSKAPFTTHQIELFVGLFEYFKEEFIILSGREEDKLNKWSSFVSRNYDKKQLDNKEVMESIINISIDERSRYRAINLRNRRTLEIRIWRGTLNGLEYLSRLEMLYNMMNYIVDYEEDYLDEIVLGDNSFTMLNLYDIITYKTDNFTTEYLESKDFMEIVNTKSMATTI